MKIIKYPDKEEWEEVVRRPSSDILSLEKTVRKILERVKQRGDQALRRYSKEFDGVKMKDFRVTERELKKAESLVSTDLKKAIRKAKQNIEIFHRAQREEIVKIETMPGVFCWRKPVPIEKVGLYIPGGSAPLFSTVLMLGVPAQLAGCNEIILCTPPKPHSLTSPSPHPSARGGHLLLKEKEKREGKSRVEDSDQSVGSEVHPAILYTARLCGISKIFKVGGAQAIAAMAYGTGSIPRVFKIFGPGNRYVTCAKQVVQQQGVAIDMPAGPSEVLVIADETAVPEFAAADLLSQAEHDPDSQAILLTTDERFAEKVLAALKDQLKELPRKKTAEKALKNSKVVVLKTIAESIELSNLYAPEHLILQCTNAEELAEKITAAGSVFIGNYSPESAGDYASGTNHVLPTSGYAAVYSGVSLDSFVKKITYQQLTKEGLMNIGNTVIEMAEAEGLEAHKKAVVIRLK